jgi:hypothetical protein
VVAVVKRLKVLATCREIWKAVSLVTNRPDEWTYLPPLVILVFRTRTDVREYVPHSRQEYSHVVALQTYVLHIGCAYGPTVACGGPDVAESPELFRFKCVNDCYAAVINSTHFKRNNPLVCRISARYNHGSTGSKQVYLARRRVYNHRTAHQTLVYRHSNIITNQG